MKKWTDEQIDLLIENYNSENDIETIEKLLGKTRDQIYHKASYLLLFKKKMSNQEKEKIISMAKSGMTSMQISSATNRCRRCIRKLCKKNNVKLKYY